MLSLGKAPLCLLLSACASAAQGLGVPDARPGDALGPTDAPVAVDAPALADARPSIDAALGDFGAMCADRGECKSGICVLGPTGGSCSSFCSAGTCPPGYGCYAVKGVVEPGQVSNVCVKDATLLCSPCSSSEECGVAGANRCLPAPSGGGFCGRDCTTVSCPAGYQCQAIAGADAGVAAQQCVPVSGACDCNAMNAGITRPCSLTTPLGTTCNGVRTCAGVSGWGDCLPPAVADVPDGSFADENCDGLDGDVRDGVFVATPANGGADSDGCGLSPLDPCARVGTGARRAVLVGRHTVFVQAGTYAETVVMTSGVSIFGGYDTQWQRADRTRPDHQVVIKGQLHAADDQYVAVVAHDLTAPTTIGDLTITGANAAGSSNRSGRSSYGIHALGSDLHLERVTVNAGKGAPGATGAAGQDAPLVFAPDAMRGRTGGGAGRNGGCDSGARGGGADPGVNACADHGGDDPRGGPGGSGGTEDTDCRILHLDYDATDGTGGGAAAVWSAAFGGGGAPGIAHFPNGDDRCSDPGDGAGGAPTDGPGGAGGGGGRVLNGYWYAFPGRDGGTGLNGSGGGGGGGSPGCDIGSPDSYGAGGGGGGAGGCAAQRGGQGGEGGGGSFGVFAVGSTLTLRDVTITQANGGRGGDGGLGGRGQDGGPGGPGGNSAGGSKTGGLGGTGGHGGHGGGGGGGSGGVSYGLFTTSDSTVQLQGTNLITDGGIAGGGPGNPGASASGGNSGTVGTGGGEAKTFVCVNPAHC
jgi:hypothetical protein